MPLVVKKGELQSSHRTLGHINANKYDFTKSKSILPQRTIVLHSLVMKDTLVKRKIYQRRYNQQAAPRRVNNHPPPCEGGKQSKVLCSTLAMNFLHVVY